MGGTRAAGGQPFMLDALGVTHAPVWGLGCAGRRPELPTPLTTEGDSFPPAGGGGGRMQRPKGGAGRSP